MSLIAQHAGVAQTTVSFVLNGRGRERGIAVDTIDRIERIAKELNYIPNAAARSMGRRRTGLIGVFFPSLNSEWAHNVMVGIQSYLDTQSGYAPLIATHLRDPKLEERNIRRLMEMQVEGIICNPIVQTENYQFIRNRGIPLVFVGHTAPGMADGSYVCWDAHRAAYSATRRLIELGRRRIACLANQDDLISQGRYEGYRQAMAEAGLEARQDWYCICDRQSPIRPALHQMLQTQPRPDAIFATLWPTALAAWDALDLMGIRIPDDIALMTMNENSATRLRMIGISSVLEPAERVGREAASAILELIRNPQSAPIQRLVSEYTSAERRSTPHPA
ncbi:MAG: LacI family DNA-binding transcriptional regulator [Candidatus Sumerlaeota bacterium]|nr:LacI family DNA-binding transcriptional regulator [Candidatus Sumerlaeota bacterium]